MFQVPISQHGSDATKNVFSSRWTLNAPRTCGADVVRRSLDHRKPSNSWRSRLRNSLICSAIPLDLFEIGAQHGTVVVLAGADE